MQRNAETFLADVQVASRYGVSRVSIWRWARERPDFPRPIKLTPGCTRWKLSELRAWEETCSNDVAEIGGQ